VPCGNNLFWGKGSPPPLRKPPPMSKHPGGRLGLPCVTFCPFSPSFFSRSRKHRGGVLRAVPCHKKGACAREGGSSPLDPLGPEAGGVVRQGFAETRAVGPRLSTLFPPRSLSPTFLLVSVSCVLSKAIHPPRAHGAGGNVYKMDDVFLRLRLIDHFHS